jgi:hypothetical protein
VEDSCQKVNPRRSQRQVASGIGNRGFARAVDHDLVSVDFPTGEIPDRSKEHVGEHFIGVREFVRPDLVSAGLAITRGPISR